MNKPSVKVDFIFSLESAQRLDRLKEVTEAKDYAKVIRDALRLYEWLVETHEKGERMALVHKDGTHTPVVIFHDVPRFAPRFPDNHNVLIFPGAPITSDEDDNSV